VNPPFARRFIGYQRQVFIDYWWSRRFGAQKGGIITQLAARWQIESIPNVFFSSCLDISYFSPAINISCPSVVPTSVENRRMSDGPPLYGLVAPSKDSNGENHEKPIIFHQSVSESRRRRFKNIRKIFLRAHEFKRKSSDLLKSFTVGISTYLKSGVTPYYFSRNIRRFFLNIKHLISILILK